MNLKNIKLEVPTFDDQLSFQVFLYWKSAIDHYFDWYDMSDEKRIQFAKKKLVGQARQYWTNIEKLMELKIKSLFRLRWDEDETLREISACVIQTTLTWLMTAFDSR